MPTHADWRGQITIDLLVRVLQTSIGHPFVAWLVPLCLRARAVGYTDGAMRVAVGYATLVSLLWLLAALNRRVAYGRARAVDLAQEVIVITGGASGVGMLMAEVYGMRGSAVAVLDVREMDDDASERGIDYYRCDVGDRTQVERTARLIERDLGTPTILINNAAVVSGKSLLDLRPEEAERNIAVNLLSHFYTIHAFLPGMLRERRGTIVTMSSVLGHLGCSQLADYTAAKAGVRALHASLTAELPPDSNVKTILVSPGQLTTPLFAGVAPPSPFLGPLVEPVEVAKAIIAAVDAGVSADLAMPLYARWIQVLAVLPVGLQRLLRAASGMDAAMRTFVGRSDDGR
ncbi:MAG: hypothetical protein M1826_003131 [Phylliscum demangeonii]|nr:MAG: hypothetical protein M1826_003131 [Phylliscum demangeonii]